ILSGSHASAYEEDAIQPPSIVFELGVPVLGICYGMQVMAEQLGGKVEYSDHREFGYAQVRARGHTRLFDGIEDHRNAEGHGLLDVWMSHGDKVTAMPPGFKLMASTASCAIAGMADEARHFYGVQFHPEVTHTRQGKAILRRFVRDICGCAGDWDMPNFIDDAVASIRSQVGNQHVVLGLSGGVDSSVAAALIHRAIGDQLTPVFVNNGLLREGEAGTVQEVFGRHFGMNLVYVDATESFLRRLTGVSDPEQKRKIIGDEFIRVFERAAVEQAGTKPFHFLAQGTLYPDVIESKTADNKAADKIKTHHNVGGLPEDLAFDLIEPLRFLFKDEVREVGRMLGLPPEIVERQPFPGPGLAVRLLGEITAGDLTILRRADAIVRQEIEAAGLARDIWQFFAVLLPVQSTGVMGDARTYAKACAIRAITSEDAMTADWARLPYDLLARMSARITNEVRGINRVVYDITSKPPGTIEWE
ncbi:MAG TPA: glutamine-hydrolyzing GMP synthase, partial [Thermomicrobiales bacterium]|nr:glutamine-hydrolyzing GMP synthase [Thermomicrobiales bacterium]